MTDRRIEDSESGFLSRWSRRKAQVREGVPVVPEAAPVVAAVPAVKVVAPQAESIDAPSRPSATDPNPVPAVTMEDVAKLVPESDYSAFVARSVDPDVRNAALKKLFTDPHYNVMDGLDTYIDDYTLYEPISKSMLRQMVQARALGMLDDELEEQPHPPTVTPHEDIDLQLQPDDAAGRGEPGESARAPDLDNDHAEPDQRSDAPVDDKSRDA